MYDLCLYRANEALLMHSSGIAERKRAKRLTPTATYLEENRMSPPNPRAFPPLD